MSVLANAADGMFGAVIAAGVSSGIFWRQSRSRRAPLQDAWRRQANELDKRLAAQYQAQITYLQAELRDCQNRPTRGSPNDRV